MIDALTNTAKKIWETVTELEAEFFSPDGTHKSDLCTFIAHDLSTIMVHLYANEFIRKMVEKVAQEGREDGHPIRLPGDYAMLQHEDLTVTFISNRPETGSLTLLDMVHTKQEVIRCRDTLSTFLALKTSSELDFTVPAQNIRNHAITLKTLPIHFLKSRFYNHQKSQESHDPEFQKMLNALGLNPCQLILSPTCTLAFALTKHFHHTVNYTFERPSNRLTHAGAGKTTLATEKVAHILGGRQLAAAIKEGCLPCRKAEEKTLSAPPGKINRHMLLPPSSHHSGVMIDMLPNLKVSIVPNQKTTRNSNHLEVSILISVCVVTKFVTFTMVNNKDANSLGEALTVMAHKTGVPKVIFTDRESGVVSLGRKAQWRIKEDGMFTSQGLGLVFCPSLGSSHQFHSTVEVKVKSIKEALGKLDLTKTSIDCISLSHKLNILASRLNDVPIICRIRASDRTNLNNILT